MAKKTTSANKIKNESQDAEEFLEPSFSAGTKKYILFVGNLSFKSTTEDIKKFFEDQGATVEAVRLSTDKKTKKPKGFAFCEFDSAESLEIALGMHHCELGGRRINVELTAGGGGHKSEKRKLKIKEKNEKYRKEKEEQQK